MPLEPSSNLDLLGELESLDLSLEPSDSTPSESKSLLDDINSLLASLNEVGVATRQERTSIEEFYDYDVDNDYTDSTGHLQAHKDVAMPDNCIMVEHDRSPGLVVSIMHSLVQYFKASDSSAIQGPICIADDGAFIASDISVEFNADLLSTLLNLNNAFSEEISVRMHGVTYSLSDSALLSKFLCT